MTAEAAELLLHDLRQARLRATHVSMYPEKYTDAAAKAAYGRLERLERLTAAKGLI